MKQDNAYPEEVGPTGSRPDGTSRAGRSAWSPRLLVLAFMGVTLLLAAVLGGFLLMAERPVSGVGASSGMPKVGGPFELVDHTGQTVTEADFAGKPMLIYFGFTYCPDVCPTALQVMTQALDRIGAEGAEVQPIFISIDPERDTPENMAAYVDHFHDRMVGLTGSPEAVREAAKAYKVYYKKAKGAGNADYLMDHSSVVFLMGPKGEYLGHFSHTTSPDEMAQGIRQALAGNSR